MRSRDSAEVDELMASLRHGWVDHGVRDPPPRCYAGAGQSRTQDVTGAARRAAASASTSDAKRSATGCQAARSTSRAGAHLCEQRLLLGRQAVGGLPAQPRAEDLRRGLGVELHAPGRRAEAQGLRPPVGQRREHRGTGRDFEHDVIVVVDGRQPVDARQQRVGCRRTGQAHRHGSDRATRGVAIHPATEGHGCELVAEAHPERGDARGHRVGEQRTGGGEPRARAASSLAPISPPSTTRPSGAPTTSAQRSSHRLPEVAAHDVELEPERGPPLAEPRHGSVGLVLHDEQARHQPSWVPTRAPIP